MPGRERSSGHVRPAILRPARKYADRTCVQSAFSVNPVAGVIFGVNICSASCIRQVAKNPTATATWRIQDVSQRCQSRTRLKNPTCTFKRNAAKPDGNSQPGAPAPVLSCPHPQKTRELERGARARHGSSHPVGLRLFQRPISRAPATPETLALRDILNIPGRTLPASQARSGMLTAARKYARKQIRPGMQSPSPPHQT
ncbi:Uncharacterised protein [Corynebacterium renale]|nr:Uncharacterised protein [Corynebacterium renale]STD02344.1 Uncharacterised protein [Corynebacterium renale]